MEDLTVEQAIELLKKRKITSSAQVVRRWLREGRIKGEKDINHGSWKISKEHLDEFIAQQVEEHNNKRTYENGSIKVRDILGLKQLIKIPIFQRKFVWKADQQSKFIFTLLEFGDSLSSIYLAEDGSGYLSVDGHQRVETIYRYADNQFKLKGSCSVDAQNKSFKDLSDKLQQRFLNATVKTVILKNYNDDDMRDLFVRLNS